MTAQERLNCGIMKQRSGGMKVINEKGSQWIGTHLNSKILTECNNSNDQKYINFSTVFNMAKGKLENLDKFSGILKKIRG